MGNGVDHGVADATGGAAPDGAAPVDGRACGASNEDGRQTTAPGAGELATVSGGSLLRAFERSGLGLEVGKPFSCPIVLLERARVAGASFVSGIDELAGGLAKGDRLVLEREPLNAADRNAIIVRAPGGEKLGYLPADKVVILARLMDGGKLLYARVTSAGRRGPYWQILVEVVLDD